MLQALEQGKQIEREQDHRKELPTALSTSIYANSQKTKPPYFSPVDFCFFHNPEESRIPSDICDAFTELSRDEMLPTWALEYAPVEDLRKNVKGTKTVRSRAWMTKGLIVVLPVTSGNLVSGMAIASEDVPSGKITLWDIDTQEAHTIVVPPGTEPGSNLNSKWILL